MAKPTDPVSASIIPFEVPEQMRALAEKGVSQARDSYAKFKDVAETIKGTIEAVFANASKGASQYSAKLMEMMKANTTANLDFAQELIGVARERAGDIEQARKEYELYLKLFPNGEGATRVRQRLASLAPPPEAQAAAAESPKDTGAKYGVNGSLSSVDDTSSNVPSR